VNKAVSDIAEKLRKTVEKNHDEVVAANAKFVKETFKTPEAGRCRLTPVKAPVKAPGFSA